MENIFNNIVDISKSSNVVNKETKTDIDLVNKSITEEKNQQHTPVVQDNADKQDDLTISNAIDRGLSQNIINMNMLLSNNPEDTHNTDMNSNFKNSSYVNIDNIMSHINELNEKIIYYNTLSKLKDNENAQLINENKVLRTNLEIIKRRFNLR